MNLRFDLTIIDRLLREQTGRGLVAMGWRGPVLDVLVIDRQVERYRKGKRRLSDLAAVYGVELVNAHNAEADTEAAIAVLGAILRRREGMFQGYDAKGLHQAQIVWHAEWADRFSEWLVGKGADPLPPHERVWPLDPRLEDIE
jgi:DNA polymerase III subunit epsilon